MEIMGMRAVRIRSNIWGRFGIIPGGHGGYAVAVDRTKGVMDRRDASGAGEEKQRLFLCGTRKQAETRLKYEATKYKRYRYY